MARKPLYSLWIDGWHDTEVPLRARPTATELKQHFLAIVRKKFRVASDRAAESRACSLKLKLVVHSLKARSVVCFEFADLDELQANERRLQPAS